MGEEVDEAVYRFLFDAIIQCRNLGAQLDDQEEFHRAKGLQAFQHAALLYEHAATLSNAEIKKQFSAYYEEKIKKKLQTEKIKKKLQTYRIDVEDLLDEGDFEMLMKADEEF